jgi:hypothetical protein
MATQTQLMNLTPEHTQQEGLLLDLTLCPLTLPKPSDDSLSTPLPGSPLTEPPSHSLKLSMWFPPLNKLSLGMQTAISWQQEQLLEA